MHGIGRIDGNSPLVIVERVLRGVGDRRGDFSVNLVLDGDPEDVGSGLAVAVIAADEIALATVGRKNDRSWGWLGAVAPVDGGREVGRLNRGVYLHGGDGAVEGVSLRQANRDTDH